MENFLASLSRVDWVWVGIVMCMLVSGFVFVLFALHDSSQRKRTIRVSDEKRIVFIVSGALFYGMMLALALYTSAPISLRFLWIDLQVINSGKTIALLTGLSIAAEVGARMWFEREKSGAVEAYNQKRTGNSFSEGINFLPGIFPVMFELLAYGLFKICLGYNAVRGVNLSPVIFNMFIVVYTRDGKAVVLSVTAEWAVKDVAAFDNARNDLAPDEEGRRAPVVASLKEFLAATIHGTSRKKTLGEIEATREPELLQSIQSVQGDLHYGLMLQHLSSQFVKFDKEALQDLYQSYAGRDYRTLDTAAKRREVDAIYRVMKKTNPSFTMDDALRMWETFNKDSTNNFRFKFP